MRLSRFALGVVVGLSFSSQATAQEPVYRIGRWAADSFGNHRAVVSVEAAAPAVWAHLPWRRPDLHPESKAVWVVDAKTGQRVINVARGSINRESGDIAFEPTSGPGEYFVYYLRYAGSVTSNYPKLTYPGSDSTAAAAWLALFDPRQLDRLPRPGSWPSRPQTRSTRSTRCRSSRRRRRRIGCWRAHHRARS